MKPTLLILAAGMGSRYGGLKQLDPVGPSGETLLDYSVFDAMRAGFDRVVFVIRHDFEREFRERVGHRYEQRVDVDYVFQGMDAVPPGHAVPEGRRKPLGTGHAIWCARESVTAPFAAINADDFYGADAYRALARFFSQPDPESAIPQFAMVGYRLGRTLSEHGSVARGVCQVDQAGYLQTIEECVGIENAEAGARLKSADGSVITFGGNEIVSMNFWGFTPAVFPMLEQGLGGFLSRHAVDEKAEFYIPVAVANMIASNSARVSVLSSESSWFGVTYRVDRALVAESIGRLVEAGNYPSNLGEGVPE
jgi:hypothetical protein